MVLFVLLFISKAYAILPPNLTDNVVSYKGYQVWQIKVHNETAFTPEFEEKLDMQGGKINWNVYPTLGGIHDYINSVVAGNSAYCSTQSIGKTSHKHALQMLTISNGNSSNRKYLIEAGMHGREWTSVISLLYFIETIAWNFTQQPDYITNKDWYFIPVTNPDGYEYSMTTDKMWRKNRRRFSGPCDGVDLNRNFEIFWGTGKRSLHNLCSMEYCGPHAFSEEETKHLRDFVRGKYFAGYVGVHSYGPKVCYPWAYSGHPTKHVGLQARVAKEMVMAMRKIDQEHFTVGTLKTRRASGTMLDFMYHEGAHNAYVIETRGKFILNQNEMRIAQRETAAGLMAMAKEIG